MALHTVTPWSATVQDDLQNSEFLYATDQSDYTFQFYNSGDSLWIRVKWPAGGEIAFRLAFAMNSSFIHPRITEAEDGLLITASTRLGSFRVNITFPESEKNVFRYTTTFRAAFPMLIPYWPRDIIPLTQEGQIENTSGRIHAHQEGGRSGQLFFSYTKPETGTVFYFQNLTAMSAYCDASETTLTNSVGGQWPEIGFQFPVNINKPVPANTEFIISDAFVFLSEVIPEKDYDIAEQYLDNLAAVYRLLPKPDTEFHDWPDIAQKALDSLDQNKACWRQTEGTPYLTAYLGDYKTPSEIMVQLAVLLPLQEYLEWTEERHRVFDELNTGLGAFYDKKIKCIVRWLPALKDELDHSEEQKQEMVMDSWYLHHPLLNLSRLALKGDKEAEQLFLNSIDYAIHVAHHFDYQWPVFYRMTTLEVLKAETEPGKGGEKDVPGSYAHIMLMAWKITREKRFLNEATKAVKKLGGLAFDIFYQANNTAFTAGALVELYKETQDEFYLKLSYCCLAGIFRNVQLWDCNYGYGKSFPTFFAVFPLNDAPYTAAYEELEVYSALSHYMAEAQDIDILPALKILIPEFIRYAVSRMPFYFPPMLPEDMIEAPEKIKTGEIQKNLWIPIEDINDGWNKSGAVGQEVYGAGIGFGVVPRQYYKIKNGALVFVDYPITGLRSSSRSVTFRTLGDERFDCSLHITGIPQKQLHQLAIEIKSGSTYKAISPKGKGRNQFQIMGGSLIRISW
jgi:hypothetical protein